MSYSIDRILYATELEPDSPRVFRHAVGIARRFNAKLHILTESQTKLGINGAYCIDANGHIVGASGHKIIGREMPASD